MVYLIKLNVRNVFSLNFSDASVSLPIEGKKYMRHLVAQAMLQFFVCIQARENAQMYISLHTFVLSLPKLQVTSSQDNVPLGQSIRVRLEFKNPLNNSLSRIIFHVCGSGLCKQKELSYKYEPRPLLLQQCDCVYCYRKLLLPGRVATMEFPIRPYQLGERFLLACIQCDQLMDVRGHCSINVTDPKHSNSDSNNT